MRVAELRAALADLPDDHLVVLAGDAEGNRYSLLAAADPCEFLPQKRPWEADIRTEGDAGSALEVNAICLWPVG